MEKIRYYGRRKGKKLKESRESLLKTALKEIRLDVSAEFDPKEILEFKKHVLEIGFGGGEHIASRSLKEKDTGFIGAEVFLNGIASLLAHLEQDKEQRNDNIRLYPDDIRKVLPFFKKESIDRVYLLFPDPWPKTRHKERRFVNHGHVDGISRILKPGGKFVVASDDRTYIKWALSVMLDRPDFELDIKSVTEFTIRPEDWHPTRYEEKAIAKKIMPVYLTFIKRG